jgi:hypothetical protein
MTELEKELVAALEAMVARFSAKLGNSDLTIRHDIKAWNQAMGALGKAKAAELAGD